MKRTYIQPTVRSVMVPATTLCAASELDIPINENPETDGTADAHGHRSTWGSLWGDK